MTDLMSLPNIGKTLAQHLDAVGIDTPQALCQIGAKDAFLRIRSAVDEGACLHMLYALQGAVEGKRYPLLHEETRNDLRLFYNSLTALSPQRNDKNAPI